ncbi:MAG: hypothetical protein IJ124_09250 [Clostridia bacterium]|nr:hypothetical protein [Clostridia bacterium]
MQPTIICTAPVPGMVYVNGRFAGEARAEAPLCLPVSPSGPVYLEYRPLSGDGRPIARRIVLSNGAPLADSLAQAQGLACVAWPGGALEVECLPQRSASEAFMLEGLPCVLLRDEATRLRLNGLELALPEGAGRPALIRLPGAAALLGGVEGGGQYLAALKPDLSEAAGLLVADRIDFAGGGMVHASVSLGDSVGHGRLEQWLLDANGLNRVSASPVWAQGAPRWPDTAEGTLIAAVEAVLAGLNEEADGYMRPSLAAEAPLDAVGEICDACVPMRYGSCGPLPCAGLLRVENDHLATVSPLYCRVEPSAGAQGPWQLAWIGRTEV